jgi:hypothetical protein
MEATMNDHPMFKEWDAIYTIWKARQDFHNALREKYPDDHPIIVRDQEFMVSINAAYEKVVNKL